MRRNKHAPKLPDIPLRVIGKFGEDFVRDMFCCKCGRRFKTGEEAARIKEKWQHIACPSEEPIEEPVQESVERDVRNVLKPGSGYGGRVIRKGSTFS